MSCGVGHRCIAVVVAVAGSYSFDLTPVLGVSICLRCSCKKKASKQTTTTTTTNLFVRNNDLSPAKIKHTIFFQNLLTPQLLVLILVAVQAEFGRLGGDSLPNSDQSDERGKQ